MTTRNIILLTLALVSCQTPWDQYDASLYETVANPSEESYAAHIATLEQLVTTDPPPPGLCAELGYFLVLTGHYPEAEASFNRELASYPQAANFLKALRSSLGLDLLPKP